MKYQKNKPPKESRLCADCGVQNLTTTRGRDGNYRCYMCSIHFNKGGKK